MWVENGPFDQYNSLQAGWMVSPNIAGNSDTRLFIFWAVDYNTGCYNQLCPGFVQVHSSLSSIALGSRFIPTSTYGVEHKEI
ncbi:hypothetical protein IFM89_005245 [Coptis chinensis]|uniref:Neprosin PEP catalytic domain-containing protein n=1 Tax=Coptis chinensis TaxID=261450 RepID=A0A835H3S2_9MAGN|nr:hypothetical protein IFM89_005245 [Coptis chinensis]